MKLRRNVQRLTWLRRGLTLLEMLVSLVIVSLVVTILAQAMGQLARIERLLEGGQLRSAVVALRAEWVRTALNGLLPGSIEAERLRGSERELQGMSSEVPQWPSSGPARLHLRLRTDPRGESTSLELLPDPVAGSEAAAVLLLQWPGREGRFVYLDAQGNWGDRWPPASSTAPDPSAVASRTLPRAVALDAGPEGPGYLLAVPLAAPNPMPTRAMLESM